VIIMQCSRDYGAIRTGMVPVLETEGERVKVFRTLGFCVEDGRVLSRWRRRDLGPLTGLAVTVSDPVIRPQVPGPFGG
jgi:hypothetical protein